MYGLLKVRVVHFWGILMKKREVRILRQPCSRPPTGTCSTIWVILKKGVKTCWASVCMASYRYVQYTFGALSKRRGGLKGTYFRAQACGEILIEIHRIGVPFLKYIAAWVDKSIFYISYYFPTS